MKNRLILPLFILLSIISLSIDPYSSTLQAQTQSDSSLTVLTGTVVDAETGESLPGALVKFVQGSIVKGFRTNPDGNYRAVLPQGKYSVEVSFLGYKSVKEEVSLFLPFAKEYRLKEGDVVAKELEVVANEDFAVTLVKRAIRYKKQQRDSLKTYMIEGYTKRILKSDTAIATLTETYANGYWRKGDTLREVVIQERLTKNTQKQLRDAGATLPAGIGRTIDFSEERVRIFGNGFISPIANDALEYYGFQFVDTRKSGDMEIHTLKLIPRNKYVPLFNGEIKIDGKKYALIGIDVKPNPSGFKLPYIKSLSLAYKQTQELQSDTMNNEVWLPSTQYLEGSLKVSVAGGFIELPKISFTQSTVIYKHTINMPVPDTLFEQKLVQKSKTAEQYDSTFWQLNEITPPTEEEKAAYLTIDSAATFQEQFRARGAGTSLTGDGASFLFNVPVIRYNRVEGWFVGAHYRFDSLTATTAFEPELGYGVERKEWLWSGTVEQWFSKSRNLSAIVKVFERTTFTPEHQSPPSIFNTYAAFFNPLSKRDYHNYFNAKGWQATIKYAFSRNGIRLGLTYLSEIQRTMEKKTDFSLFIRDQQFRDNPPVIEGQMRSVLFNLDYGNRISLLGISTPYYAKLELEHSGSELASNFNFTRVWAVGSLIQKTFYTERFLAPYLFLQIEGGANIGGALPPQRFFSVDAQISGMGAIGAMYGLLEKELLGTAMVSVIAEHNFQSIPFEAVGLDFLADENIQLILKGGYSKVWLNQTQQNYSEIGLGIGGILGLFRAYGVLSFLDNRSSRLSYVITGSVLF
ncbi:MAG: DUF5686 family protein [Chloroherpetonaceae bacterium]|nr:DUF5686 family protein [Chloroherpetonaceae bacterium]